MVTHLLVALYYFMFNDYWLTYIFNENFGPNVNLKAYLMKIFKTWGGQWPWPAPHLYMIRLCECWRSNDSSHPVHFLVFVFVEYEKKWLQMRILLLLIQKKEKKEKKIPKTEKMWKTTNQNDIHPDLLTQKVDHDLKTIQKGVSGKAFSGDRYWCKANDSRPSDFKYIYIQCMTKYHW